MAHDARERHPDGPGPLEVLDELRRRRRPSPPASPAAASAILNRSAVSVAVGQVDGRRLHPGPADVDAERPAPPSRVAGYSPVRSRRIGAAGRRSRSVGGRRRAVRRPARVARVERAGHRRPGRLGDEQLGLGQRVLRLPGRAEVDDDGAARRRRVDRRPRRRRADATPRACRGAGRSAPSSGPGTPAASAGCRAIRPARCPTRRRPGRGRCTTTPGSSRRRRRCGRGCTRRSSAALASCTSGGASLRPGVAAVAAPAAVEEAVGARRRRAS